MRVYTKATERLKEIHRNYRGYKSGSPETAKLFDNTHSNDETGGFSAISGTTHHYYKERGYREVTEQEFINIINNKIPLVDNNPTEDVGLPPPSDDKPEHYSKGIDTFQRMEANCTVEECLAFVKGNIDKYNWREKGQDLEDFDKIIAYANWGKELKVKQGEQ